MANIQGKETSATIIRAKLCFKLVWVCDVLYMLVIGLLLCCTKLVKMFVQMWFSSCN